VREEEVFSERLQGRGANTSPAAVLPTTLAEHTMADAGAARAESGPGSGGDSGQVSRVRYNRLASEVSATLPRPVVTRK
jgi:hypothetical protein